MLKTLTALLFGVTLAIVQVGQTARGDEKPKSPPANKKVVPQEETEIRALAGWRELSETVTSALPSGDKQPGLVEQFRALTAEVDAQVKALLPGFEKEFAACKTDAEREAVRLRAADETDKLRFAAAAKVLELVRPHAADPAAVEALVWVMMSSNGAEATQAAALAAKHHLSNASVIDAACRTQETPKGWAEPLLRTLLASELPKAARARVLYSLATVRQRRSQFPALLATITPTQLALMERIYGKDTVAEYRKLDAVKAEADALDLFAELRDKLGAEESPARVRYDSLAKAAIFEIQNLSVGKLAPDIVGEDTDGVKFKLSDHRGKVVVLTFWGTWCAPCMALVPHEKEIVARFKGKPFALIGVNADTDLKKLKQVSEKAGITWRSFWCGENGPLGDIPKAWNVTGWPTVYVLDHKGTIRAKQLAGEELDRLLDKLVKERRPPSNCAARSQIACVVHDPHPTSKMEE